jgi:hypothetical protein
MTDLRFRVEGAEPIPFATDPQIALRVRVYNPLPQRRIHGALLRCQVRVRVERRAYGAAEEQRLVELFGERNRWGTTMHDLLWALPALSVPAFDTGVEVDLALPCSFDFDVGITKYLHALDGGVLPLSLVFRGTVFFGTAAAPIQVAQIHGSKGASYALPLAVWQRVREAHYPDTSVVALRRDLFERLVRFKVRGGWPTLDHALERLLPPDEARKEPS